MRIAFLFYFLLCTLLADTQGGRGTFWAGRSKTQTSQPSTGFNWAALTPQSPTMYNNAGTVVVENKSFTNLNSGVLDGDLVRLLGTGNITFKNCYFGPAIRNGATIGDGFSGLVRFEGCLFVSQKMGIEVSASNCTVQIENCQCINPWGAPVCKGQFFQAVNSTMTNSYIRNCAMENFVGLGSPEDWISFFGSGGTSSSRFIVENNHVRRGGPSRSGGGFMLGDHGGGYVTVRNNKFLDPGNYQIAVSGGNNFTIENNLAYSTNTGYVRIGMYAYGQQGYACSNVIWQNNGMWIYNGNSWYPGDGSPAESCGTITGANPTFTQTNITNLTLAQLNFPSTIITHVDRDRLMYLIEEGMQFRNVTGSCVDNVDVFVLNTVPIPTPNAGSNQTISGTSTTLNATGSTSSAGLNYQWYQVDGPVNTTIASPTSSITGVSGLNADGVYQYRVEVTNNNGAVRAARVNITKNSF